VEVSHAYGREGRYAVTAVVRDEKGKTVTASMTVTVENVPPIAEAGGPYGGPAGSTVEFHGTAADPGSLDRLTYAWDLNGDGTFETIGQNALRLYPVFGRYTVRLRVTDDAGAAGSDTAAVLIADDTPRISGLAAFTTAEGTPFATISLDAAVSDPFHADAQLEWSVRGAASLHPSINNRILTVGLPDNDWSGVETLRLSVSDPAGHVDSASVRFTVTPVNDPPTWVVRQLFLGMSENGSLDFPIDSLRARVADPDNPVSTLHFSIRTARHFSSSYDPNPGVLRLKPAEDWFGTEKVVFVAEDPAGAAGTDTCTVRVTEVREPPDPFSLAGPMYFHSAVWPDTIRFTWHASHTGDAIGVVYYAWILKRQEQGGVPEPARRLVVFDTTLAFVPDLLLDDGVYFWNVEAVDQYGQLTPSDNLGILQIGFSGAPPASIGAPRSFALGQNYPNPFNPETAIRFSLPRTADVRLAVYNPLGQEVTVLAEGRFGPGVHAVRWNGKDETGIRVPSGVYLYRLDYGDGSLLKKMLLMQ